MLEFLLLYAVEDSKSNIEYLYYNFYNDMIRLAKTLLKNANIHNYNIDAEDAVQNSLLKIIINIDLIDFNKTRNEIKSYVLSIVAHEVSNIISDYYLCESYEELDESIADMDDEMFFESIHIKEKYNDVVKAIEKLDYKYSTTLNFYYFDKMDINSISKLLGIPEKTVYTRLQRGRAKLMDYLKGEEK